MSVSYFIEEVIKVGENAKYTGDLRNLISEKMHKLFNSPMSSLRSVKLNDEERKDDWKQVLTDIEHLDSFELYLYYYHEVNIDNFDDCDSIFSILHYFETVSEEFLCKNQYIFRDTTGKSENGSAKLYSYNYNGSGNHGLVKFSPIKPEQISGKWNSFYDLFEVYRDDVDSDATFNKIVEKAKKLYDYSDGEYAPGERIAVFGDYFKDNVNFVDAINIVCELNKEFMSDLLNSYEMVFDSEDNFSQLKVKFNVEEGTAEYEYAAV